MEVQSGIVVGYRFSVKYGEVAAVAMAMAKVDFIGDCYRLIICEKCGTCGERFCANFAFWEALVRCGG